MLYGVDVHGRYQAGISFATLKAQGYTFAAVKATQGVSLLAPQFVEWTAQIRAVGMVPGAYHWIDNKTTGAEQARYFYNRVRTAGGPEGFLIQLDNEDTTYPATLTHTKGWAAEWAQLSGGHPFLMYTGKWWWGPRGWDGNSITPYLWDSHYLTADLDSVPDDPAAFAARIPASWWNPGYGNWPSATFLQFTSRGDAGGLANNVDLNCTRLTYEQLLALTTSGGDLSMLCKYADKGSKVEALQRLLLKLDPTCLDPYGPDGSYGDKTAAAMVSLGVGAGGDTSGKNYGPTEYANLAVLLAQKFGGAPTTVPPHQHAVSLPVVVTVSGAGSGSLSGKTGGVITP